MHYRGALRAIPHSFNAARLFSSSQDAIHNYSQQALKSSNGVDITYPTTPVGVKDKHIEPRFLENVQLFVESAAGKVGIKADMLKFIMACDNVIRF